ncbi:MAG: helix-turn-helix transcriptional regulator [Oscillospiraceae bacterium]|nr:helix-turn-helix transcriptional regulator [Oscillospiraceae bacterium]
MFQKKQFGERLCEVRKKHNEKQKELAEILGVRDSQICEIENGNRTTTVERIVLICRHYNISADYLLGLTDDPKPHKRKKEEEPQ